MHMDARRGFAWAESSYGPLEFFAGVGAPPHCRCVQWATSLASSLYPVRPPISYALSPVRVVARVWRLGHRRVGTAVTGGSSTVRSCAPPPLGVGRENRCLSHRSRHQRSRPNHYITSATLDPNRRMSGGWLGLDLLKPLRTYHPNRWVVSGSSRLEVGVECLAP